jgi:hypothetical protein
VDSAVELLHKIAAAGPAAEAPKPEPKTTKKKARGSKKA